MNSTVEKVSLPTRYKNKYGAICFKELSCSPLRWTLPVAEKCRIQEWKGVLEAQTVSSPKFLPKKLGMAQDRGMNGTWLCNCRGHLEWLWLYFAEAVRTKNWKCCHLLWNGKLLSVSLFHSNNGKLQKCGA